MENQNNVVDAQGAEAKEKRAVSKSQTLKSFQTTVLNLKETGLVNEKDYKALVEIYKKSKLEYLGEDLL